MLTSMIEKIRFVFVTDHDQSVKMQMYGALYYASSKHKIKLNFIWV